jgi:hypothetical protein
LGFLLVRIRVRLRSGQVGKRDRGRKCPKISRRYAPGFHQKQGKRPKIFRYDAPKPYRKRVKRPKISRRYASGDPPPDFPAHIKYVPTALFPNL